MSKKTGVELKIVKAVVKDPAKSRSLPLEIPLSADPNFILEDPAIDLVIELMGGHDQAFEILKKTLTAKKAWVSANKAMIAENSREVWSWFEKHPKKVAFEASVGGAMPILRFIQDAFASDQIISVKAILNGTTNFILSEISKRQIDFAAALKLAQEKGYAEADPSLDISGKDTAHKIYILGQLAFHHQFDFHAVSVQGIEAMENTDIQLAKSLGFEIKLLGVAKSAQQNFSINVYPALVPTESPLAQVEGSFNAAEVTGRFLGEAWLQGLGAGSHPTAVAVVSDVLRIARDLQTEPAGSTETLNPYIGSSYELEAAPLSSLQEWEHEHYLRIRVLDEIRILAKITNILSDHELSVHKILQVEAPATPKGQFVDIVILTHKGKNRNLHQAKEQLQKIHAIAPKVVWYRIEGKD